MPEKPREPTPVHTRPVEANIETAANLERSFQEGKTLTDRIAAAIGTLSGSLLFVGLQITWFTLWLLINTGHIHAIHPFDPYPFTLLSLMVAIEAVLLSTFVLMEQNLMQRRTDHRDHLNLQIDLLSEQEITKCLQLLQMIAHKMKIDEVSRDEELEEMTETTSVDQLADRIKSELPVE